MSVLVKRLGRPRSEQAERAIIEAVLDLLADHGVSGLTIEQVANYAGVAKTTIYRRWPDKHALILDAIESLKGPIVRPPGRSVRHDLVYLLRRTRDNIQKERADRIMPKLYAEAHDHPELMAACQKRILRPRRQVLIDVLARGVAEGLIRADIDRDLIAELLFSPLIFSAISRRHRRTDAEIDVIVDTVLTGITGITPSAG